MNHELLREFQNSRVLTVPNILVDQYQYQKDRMMNAACFLALLHLATAKQATSQIVLVIVRFLYM